MRGGLAARPRMAVLLGAVLVSAGCIKDPQPVSSARIAELRAEQAERDRTWAKRKVYDMDGTRLTLAISPEKRYVLFGQASGRPITHGEIDKNVAALTGCQMYLPEGSEANTYEPHGSFGNTVFFAPLEC